ncbi:MAG TPA: carboxypeptidase-like regulatory domain-containing protein [Candidatus Thermoplasmatota archaeon]|nr:carboxypeptidase-like regulatory domain-containing protein [Candidatus Thermoplasmatota archaeon]
MLSPRPRRPRPGPRPPLALALVFVLVLAGCAKPDGAVEEHAIAPGTLAGTVTDLALTPIAGANVTVEGTNASALTDAAGSFTLELLPGEYVVLAMASDHQNGAMRASILSAQTSSLSFQLAPIVHIVPYNEVQEGEGYLACTILLVQGESRNTTECGESDPNDRPSVDFPLASANGLDSVVVELAWEPRTQAASSLHVDVWASAGEERIPVGTSEGASPLRVVIPARLVGRGDALVVTASPAGGFTDEEAGVDFGAIVQQPFTAYATAFYHAPPPGGYSAIASSGSTH